MQIQFIRQHLGFSPGAIVGQFPASTCALLIERGVAKALDPELVETKPARVINTKPLRKARFK